MPDQPITSFEAKLPIGAHSILAGNGYLCAENLKMPTTITAQNGAVTSSTTTVSVKGCPLTRPQKRAKAIALCRRTDKGKPSKRVACEKQANRAYAAKAGKANATQGAANLTAAAPAAHLSGSASAQAQATPAAEAPPGSCPNEALRAQSNWDEATGKPYSENLPECRAYEMVSPVEKQGSGVSELTLVSPSGEAVGYTSEGAFASPNNFSLLGLVARNSYVARRNASSQWMTTTGFAPASLIEAPSLGAPLASDFAPELGELSQAACGNAPSGGYTCAGHGASGWPASSTTYWPTDGLTHQRFEKQGYADLGEAVEGEGPSAEISRVFLQPLVPLIPEDHLANGGLYELSLNEGTSARPRLVNVGPEGEELSLPLNGNQTPLLGDSGGKRGSGTAAHAVSQNGEMVFFTATPPGGANQTVYARVRGRTTIAVSAPEGCSGEPRCARDEEGLATFQGASTNGCRVFFTTEQELLPGETERTTRLYEYAFSEEPLGSGRCGSAGHLVALSGGSESAEVRGVVRTSANGAEVYFVATGVLAGAAKAGANNLYVADARTGIVSFIVALPPKDTALWGRGCSESSGGVACDNPEGTQGANVGRFAQVTPDGRFLVFSTYEPISLEDRNGCSGETEGNGALLLEVCRVRAVYRFDATSGELTWLSRPAPDLAGAHEGQEALIQPLNGNRDGATADFEDAGRAISGSAADDGRYVVFSSSERLQAGDVSKGQPQVYLWHCSALCDHPASEGLLSMISDGQRAHRHAGNFGIRRRRLLHDPDGSWSRGTATTSAISTTRAWMAGWKRPRNPRLHRGSMHEPGGHHGPSGPIGTSVFSGGQNLRK